MEFTYSDIDFKFNAHPISGDVTRRYDSAAVKESVKNLVRTRFYDRPFNSSLGSSAANLLFENFTPMTGTLIEETIKEVIRNFEPRASVVRVDVNAKPDSTEVDVNIHFKLINTNTLASVSVLLVRTR